MVTHHQVILLLKKFINVVACIPHGSVNMQITAKGAAEKNGQLKVGQRILEVNGTSLLGATHLVAVRALRTNPMEVSLLVCDGYDPREVVRRRTQDRLSVSSNASATLDSSSLSSEGKLPLLLVALLIACNFAVVRVTLVLIWVRNKPSACV